MDLIVLTTMLHMFVGDIAAARLNPIIPGSIGELTAALNTGQKIWLYKRAGKSNDHKCLSWQRVSLVNTEYTFNEVYWESNNKQQTNHLVGTITSKPKSGDEGSALDVTGKSEEGTNEEYLLAQWNSTEQCGIFYTEKMNTDARREKQTCGLYFWSESVDNEGAVEKCKQGYEYYCAEYKKDKPEQTLYESDCQTLQGC
uniref:Lipocalin n=1 Tax=Rhipicephalus zambeziensis TaxID=60191 RepID=A0A224YC04_9ACAR